MDPDKVAILCVVALVHLIARDIALQQSASLVQVGVEIIGISDVLERKLSQFV